MSLINKLIKEGVLKTPELIKAFKKIKREDFVLPEDKDKAEINAPLPIGHGQTISQPLTVAFMLELLQPKEKEKILDVGNGSGWTTALLAEAIGEEGKVYGVERIAELKEFADGNIGKYDFFKKGVAQTFCGDGYEGLPESAPFDKILVSAAAPVMPAKLLKQLKAGGRLVIPLGGQHETQDIVAVDKRGEGDFKEKRYPGFAFVPLVKNRI